MALVYPVFDAHDFKIGTKGTMSTSQDMKSISLLETFSVSIDNGVEEWHPFEDKGWVRRLMTAKSLTISLSGKRDYDTVSNEGNAYVAGLMFETGNDAKTKFEWHMPQWKKNNTHAVVKFDCVVSVSATGGDSTAIDSLEFDVMSDGKVTIDWVADEA